MRHRYKIQKHLSIAIIFLLVASCNIKSIPDQPTPIRLVEETPSASLYLDQAPPQSRPKVFAPGLVSVEGRFEMGFTMSPNGRHIAFGVAHESDTNKTNIYFIHRKGNGWSKPSTAALHDNTNTFFPMFGPMGRDFYYTRAIPGADNDIWVGNFKDGKISKSISLSPLINSQYREAGHGRTFHEYFLFTSNRDQAQACCGDVYQYTAGESGKQVEKVETLSSLADEESLFLSPDGDYVIIQAWKPEFNTKHDLYISYRTKNGGWTSPWRLPDEINGSEIEQRPFVSPDKKYLFFSRMSISNQGGQTQYDSDIYWVNMQQVFTPFVYNPVGAYHVEAGRDFSISLPFDIFKYSPDQKTAPFSVTLADGSQLPEHISFDVKRRLIHGDLKGERSLVLKLTATDAQGQSASHILEILAK